MSAHRGSLSTAGRRAGRSRRLGLCLGLLAATGLAGCGGEPANSSAEETITLYTCSSDEAVQPIIADFEEANPGATVELFRAPTGELNARIAADIRSGGLRADVIWACDPLTMQSYMDQDLVGGWVPDDADEIPEEFRTGDYVGAHVLYMVAVHNTDAPAPATWQDLAGANYRVALPDPTIAASALGTLGYFSRADGYGMTFYEDLKRNGAVQVSTPDDVIVGVAQGSYDAGVTIANSAYQAKEDGSPIDVVWPEPGAVAIYGPIALATESDATQTAQAFISYVVSRDGQTVVAEADSYPAMEGVGGPTIPEDAPVAFPDWTAISEDQDALLNEYSALFGG